MKVIWTKAPCPAGTVIEALAGADTSWHPKTIKTFLNRLVKKGVLAYRKEGRAYFYRATVSEKQCVDAVSDSFLQRVFGGSLRPMLAHFVEHKKLSPTQIRELRTLLEE